MGWKATWNYDAMYKGHRKGANVWRERAGRWRWEAWWGLAKLGSGVSKCSAAAKAQCNRHLRAVPYEATP